jgi:peptide-methionine (S)-S-oxide reductase
MTAIATFAAGCFWGVEHRFRKLPGVLDTQVGYMGGHLENPTYKQVCTDRSGHAEVVQLVFDPAQLSYEALVRHFYAIHDPTTRNRQGPDLGTQYRSAIFFHDAGQQAVAAAVTAELNAGPHAGRIVTEQVPAGHFWRAEEYHQQYADKHPEQACAL